MRDLTDGSDFYFAADVLNQHRNFPRGTVVIGTSGLEVTSDGTNMTLDVAAGTASIDNTSQNLTATTVTLDAADSFVRYDLVVVQDNAGTYEVTKVTGTTEKVTPTLQPTQVLLAIVEVPANTTTIPAGNVYDARLLSTSTENDGTFNTLKVTTAPTASDDVARKAELDTKSDTGHDHATETITPATIENGDYTWTSTELMVGQNITDNGGSNKVGLGGNASIAGEEAVGVGYGVTVDGLAAVGIGSTASATSTEATAVGHSTTAGTTGATAIGNLASATGLFSVALGHGAKVTDDESIAIGDATVDTGTSGDINIAIGQGAAVLQGSDALAIGPGASASQQEIVSIGHDTAVSGSWAVGVGRNVNVSASSGLGVGRDANVTGMDGVAIGPYANVTNDKAGHIAVDQLRFGAVSGTIPDSSLGNGEMTIEADETNGQFTLRYKDSNGVVQTSTLLFN